MAGTQHQAAELDGDPRLPLYRRLQVTIARMISDGAYKPGLALPAELEIARFYNLAPGTARKAIEELVNEGLLERRHGAGTFVRRPNFNNSMLRFFRFRDASGKQLTPESRILSRSIVSATDKLATDLSMLPGEKVIHLHRVRLWDGDVRLVEDIYLPFALFEPILEIGEADIGPLLYPVYEAHCGQLVTFIKEEISITNVAPDDATLLGLQPSQPAVVIDRLALNPSRTPIEWRRSRGDAHRFHYVVEGA